MVTAELVHKELGVAGVATLTKPIHISCRV